MSFLLPCPRQFAVDAISNALTAQRCGTGNNSDGRNLDVAGSCRPTRCLEGLREHNARASLVVSHKILGFLETPSSRLVSRWRVSPRTIAATGRFRLASGFYPRHRPEADARF